MVRTQHPTVCGAWALWSCGVAATSDMSVRVIGPSEHLDDVQDAHVAAALAQPLLDLENAARVRGHDRLGARRQDVVHLPVEEPRGHLGLCEVVDAGRSAAPVRLREINDLQTRDLGEKLAGLDADFLTV